MVSTPRGNARSMTELSPLSYDVRVNGARPNGTNFSASGADWMGPLLPIQPIAPPQVAGRTWDFVPGYNLATQPRAYEPVGFHALRSLAEAFDPVRLIIERRKDQMCRVPWAIRVKHDDPTKKRPAIAELSKAKRQRLADLANFFKYPDREVSFRSWLRSLLDDLLITDAPTLFCEHNYGGDLIGLRVTDGSTIKRVIDSWGRTPEPIIWTGQPFDWNGQTITEENYRGLGFVLAPGYTVAHQMPMGMAVPKEVLMPPAYQQVLHGLPAVTHTTKNLIYRPMNLRPGHIYGMSPVEQIMTTVSIAMRRAHSQLEYFREGNQPDAIYSLPENWSPDQTQRFQDYFDSLYSGNLANRRRMKFIPGGTASSYTATKEPPLKNEFDEWLVRIACFAFSYPPQAFVALSNRSTAEQHEKTAEEEGLQPLKAWASDMLNEIISRRFGEDDIEFAWTEEEEVDQEKQAAILTGYAEDGVLTLNQVREKLGEQPDPNPAANMLMVKTALGYVPIDANSLENKVAEAKAMAAAVPAPTPAPVKTGGPKPTPDEE